MEVMQIFHLLPYIDWRNVLFDHTVKQEIIYITYSSLSNYITSVVVENIGASSISGAVKSDTDIDGLPSLRRFLVTVFSVFFYQVWLDEPLSNFERPPIEFMHKTSLSKLL